MAEININDIFGSKIDKELEGIIKSIQNKVTKQYANEFKKLNDELNKSKDENGNPNQEALKKYSEARLKLETEVNAKIKSEIEKNNAYKYKLERDNIKKLEEEKEESDKRLNDKKAHYDKLRNDESLKNETKTEEEILDQKIENQNKINAIKEKYSNDEIKTENTKELKKLQAADKFIEYVKNGVNRLLQHVNELSDKMVFDNWKKGIVDTANNYEKYFTEIAGRTGAATRQQTHDLIKGTVEEINKAEYTLKGLNFNEDVFPKLEAAVKAGFQGKEAQDIAITNAIDQKIMPWLNTSSETWTQLQYNLSSDSLNQIKAQQLLLQETREGNRILQSGVVDELSGSLLPIMQSIDANGSSAENMGAAYEIVEKLIDDGMTKTDAVAYVKQLIKAETDTYGALTSNDVATRMMGIGAMNGGGIAGAQNAIANSFGAMISGANGELSRGAIAHTVNLTLPSDDAIYKDIFTNRVTGKYSNVDSSIYTNKVSNLEENVTATQAWDNGFQNKQAERTIDANLYAHGADAVSMIQQDVADIKSWLIRDVLGGLLDKGIDKIGGKLIKGLFNKGTKEAAEEVVNNGFTSSMSNYLNGENAFSSGANGLSGFKEGFIGNLKDVANSGAGITKAQASGMITAGALQLAGGGIIAKSGVDSITESLDLKRDKTSIDKEKTQANWDMGTGIVATGAGATAAIAGGLGVAGGIAGLTGGSAALAALGAAAGPVGWVALGVGAAALGVKAIADHVTRLSGLADVYEEKGEELKAAFSEQQDAKIEEAAFLKEQITKAEDATTAQNEIINSGLLSEKTARELTAEELKKLTGELLETELAIKNLGEASIDAKTKIAKEEAQQQTVDVLNKTYENIKGLLGDDNKVKEGDKEYTQIKSMFEGMTSSITNEEDRKKMQEQLDTMFAEGEFDLKELQILMNKGGNWRSLWHTSIDRKNNFYDYAMDVESANAYLGMIDNNGRYDLHDINIAQETAGISAALDKYYEDYKSAETDEEKEAQKNKYINKWKSDVKINSDYYEYLKPNHQNQANEMGLKEFRLGSQYIPHDQLAQLHEGERVLTKEQNTQYQNNMMTINKILDSDYDNVSNISTLFDKIFDFNNKQSSNAPEYELKQTSNDNIMLGLQDVVLAIQTQTKDIISYLSTMNFSSNSSYSNLEYNPEMGNTRVFAKL